MTTLSWMAVPVFVFVDFRRTCQPWGPEGVEDESERRTIRPAREGPRVAEAESICRLDVSLET